MEFFVNETNFYGIYIKLIVLLWQCSFSISADPLPFDVTPEVYTVRITSYPSEEENGFLFQGIVTIQVVCVQSTKTVILDAVNLTIHNQNYIFVRNEESPEHTISATGEPDLQGKFIINLDEALIPENTYAIILEYNHSPGDLVGYIDNFGLLESHIQTNKYAARHVFPCFDRIDFKALFNIQLHHEEQKIGFSTTQLESRSESDGDGYVTEIFESSEYAMSTYSVTLALTPLGCHLSQAGQRYTFSHINIRYCIERSSQRIMMRYVVETTVEILIFLSSFLNMIYPLNKFDIILQSGGPDDFSEGYGLVLTRPLYLTSVINQPENDPSFRYEGIKRLGYVLSHHWFGHLVTMDWEESWIHDGLNIYIQWQWAAERYVTFQNIPYPDTECDIISSFLQIMKKEESEDWILMSTENPDWDSEPGSHDIQLKAAHLFRMIDFFMGPVRFKAAIRHYLDNYQFKNTNLHLVWNSFTETVANHSPPTIFNNYFTVEDVMKYWINQNGHPLILVQRDYQTGQVILSQQRFIIPTKNEAESSQASEICWTIPFTYRIESGVRGFDWFFCGDEGSTNAMYLPVGSVNNNHWVLIDIELSVLCRVQYDEYHWMLIKNLFLKNLERYQITELNRVRIISDMFTQAKVGRLSYRIAFETVMYLHQETSYAVWKVATDELHEIRSRLLASKISIHKAFKKCMQKLLAPMFQRRVRTNYEFERNNPSELDLSVLIMEQACTYGVKSCLHFGTSIINDHSELDTIENSRIPYSINKAIHCQEVKKTSIHRDKLWDMYQNTTITNKTKELILMALGCTRSLIYLIWYLRWSLDTSIVSRNDRLLIFKSVSLNVKGYDELRIFFQNYYASLIQGPSASTGTGQDLSIIPYWQIILDATNHQTDLNELIIFAQQQNVDLQSEWMQKSIANAQRNIHWHIINKKSVKEVFLSLGGGPSCPTL